ncbi:MAG TPA: TGS domain-containing protein, partial [Thermodesulfovibrionales bacterium]|nr:TGS domain-containing protein [Thermodesulfovibrionales bacterium]
DLAEDVDIQSELLINQLAEWKILLLEKNGLKETKEGFAYKRCIVAGNKIDLPGAEEGMKMMERKYGSIYPIVGISTRRKEGIEELRQAVFENAGIIRVYSKEPGKGVETDTPFILPVGSSVIDLAEFIHRDFVINLKYACIWGSAKFEGQRVQRDYVLHDRDVVEFHVK